MPHHWNVLTFNAVPFVCPLRHSESACVWYRGESKLIVFCLWTRSICCLCAQKKETWMWVNFNGILPDNIHFECTEDASWKEDFSSFAEFMASNFGHPASQCMTIHQGSKKGSIDARNFAQEFGLNQKFDPRVLTLFCQKIAVPVSGIFAVKKLWGWGLAFRAPVVHVHFWILWGMRRQVRVFVFHHNPIYFWQP